MTAAPQPIPLHAVRRATTAPAPVDRMGPLSRLVDRATRRWTIDLFDSRHQLDGADIDADLRRGQR